MHECESCGYDFVSVLGLRADVIIAVVIVAAVIIEFVLDCSWSL